MPRYGYYEPEVNSAVVSAVRLAFVRARTSPRNWKHRQDEGRLDPRNVWRQQATARADIFRDRTAPGASKVNLHILVDGSGSMDSQDQLAADGVTKAQRIERAADITATLTEAFRAQPQVRLNIWLHNTVANTGNIGIWPVVTNGHGRENIGWMKKLTGGGNGDGYAIKWVGRKVRHDHRKGEVDLLIVVSDGLPSWLADSRVWNHPDASNGVALVFNAVQELREAHIRVLSIAIAPNKNQQEMYGEQGVIPFTGDWNELATSIAKTLGETLSNAAKDPRTARR